MVAVDHIITFHLHSSPQQSLLMPDSVWSVCSPTQLSWPCPCDSQTSIFMNNGSVIAAQIGSENECDLHCNKLNYLEHVQHIKSAEFESM